VSAAPQPGRLRITLVGEVPIDIWPDATVRVDIFLTPTVEDGVVGFRLDIDTDVDTGVLGDLFAGFLGGLLGLLLGLLSGGALLPFIAGGFVAGMLILEIAEVVVAGVVTRTVRARIDGEAVPPPMVCDNEVVVLALPGDDDGGFALDALDAIPASVRIATEEPDPLHLRHVLVVNTYDSAVVDGNGLAFTATATTGEAFEPVHATLVDATRPAENEPLTSLAYDTADAQGVQIAVEDVLTRAAEDELTTPLKPEVFPNVVRPVVPGGRIPIVCLTAQAIRRKETVITDIKFTTGLELTVPETVLLQDAGALVLPGLQLIHPSNASPYFRSKPDDNTENNLESMPPF
jgi:hypothetical protein